MDKPNLEAIDALIAAGDKATKGKWIDCKEEYGVTDKIMAVTPAQEVFENWVIIAYNDDPIINKNDKKYITYAANTRSEIKKLRDAYKKQAKAIKVLREALEGITQERLNYDNSCAIGRDGLEYCEDCDAYETKKGNDWVLEHEENCPYIIAVRTLEQTRGYE